MTDPDRYRYKARIAVLEEELAECKAWGVKLLKDNRQLYDMLNGTERTAPLLHISSGTIELNNCKSVKCTSAEFSKEQADGKS